MNPHSPGARRGIAWFVSRHAGAIDWARRRHLRIDRWVTHLDPAQVSAGDIVMGTLPVNLAAELCQRGAHYLHLSLNVPAGWRGRELSSSDLQHLAAQIVPYHIQKMSHNFPVEFA